MLATTRLIALSLVVALKKVEDECSTLINLLVEGEVTRVQHVKPCSQSSDQKPISERVGDLVVPRADPEIIDPPCDRA